MVEKIWIVKHYFNEAHPHRGCAGVQIFHNNLKFLIETAVSIRNIENNCSIILQFSKCAICMPVTECRCHFPLTTSKYNLQERKLLMTSPFGAVILQIDTFPSVEQAPLARVATIVTTSKFKILK